MKVKFNGGIFLSRKPSDSEKVRDNKDFEEDYDREYYDRDDRRYDEYDDYDRDYEEDDRGYEDDYDDDYDRDYKDDDRYYEEDDYDREYDDDRDYEEDDYDREYDDSDRYYEEDEYERDYDDSDRDYEEDDYDREYEDDRYYEDDNRSHAKEKSSGLVSDGYVEYDLDKEFAIADEEFEDTYEDDYVEEDREFDIEEFDRDERYEDGDYEYDGGFDDRYDDEEFGRGHKASLKGGYSSKRHPNRRAEDKEDGKVVSFFGKAGEIFRNTGPVEKVAAAVAIVIFLGAIATGVFYTNVVGKNNQISSFADIGSTIGDVQIIGESGLIAVADAEKAKAMTAEIVEEAEEEEVVEEPVEEENASVSLNLTSIKGDLKMKFINGTTKKLVSNTPFKVSVVTPDGSTVDYEDDDRDGIIYKKDLKPGKYKVTPKELPEEYSKYKLDTTPKSVEVKEKVDMKPVDVSNEVKKESQVNAAKEDTAVKNVVESVLKDTVEYVESEKIPLDGSDSDGSGTFKEIGKDNIPNPTQTSKIDFTSFRTVALRTVGEPSNGASTEAKNNSDEATSTSGGDNTSDSDKEAAKKKEEEEAAKKKEDEEAKKKADEEAAKKKEEEEAAKKAEEEAKKKADEEAAKKKAEEEAAAAEASRKAEQDKKDLLEKNGAVPVPTSITLKVGETKKLESSVAFTAKLTKDNGCITFKDNVITAVKAGSGAQITASAENYKDAIVNVTVAENTFNVTNNNVELKVGDTFTIAGVDPKLPGYKIELANSADNGIVTLSGNTIKAVKQCDRTINIKISANGYTTYTFTVKKINAVAAGDLPVKFKKVTLVEGESIEIGLNAADYDSLGGITKNKNVVTVSGTKLEAKKAGTANVQFSAKGYNTVTIEVKVVAKKELLKDKEGRQVYIKDSDGKFREATYADYNSKDKFYLKDKEEGNYKYKGWQTINGKTYYYTKDGEYVTGKQVIQGAEYVFGSDGVLSSSTGGRGIDVSKWNGKIDWKAVKNEGIDFVIIRCGYRGSSAGALIEDPNFKTNIKGAQAAGLKVGVYFFTQAVNEAEAVEEASMVIGLCKGYGITYPVYLDVEGSNGRGDTISAAQRTANIRAFCGTIQNAGYKPGVYANKTWFTSKINTSQLTSFKIWLAQYAASPSYTASRYDMWQYTSKGKVSGISGNVDLNIMYR